MKAERALNVNAERALNVDAERALNVNAERALNVNAERAGASRWEGRTWWGEARIKTRSIATSTPPTPTVDSDISPGLFRCRVTGFGGVHTLPPGQEQGHEIL